MHGLRRVDAKDILRGMQVTYRDVSHVKVHFLDESDLPLMPEGWEAWRDRVISVLGFAPDRVFAGNGRYVRPLREHFGASFHIIDPERTGVPITTSRIRREGILRHWETLAGVCRPFFAKRVVLVGTESCGKTTLTRYLAKRYATSWVEEYSRTYAAEYLGGCEDTLRFEDYGRIAMGHKIAEERALRRANRVVFVDTEAVVTQYYCQIYEGRKHPVVEEIARDQEYDLWLHLPPDVPWVSDGMRRLGDESLRRRNDELLLEMLASYGVRPVTVPGSYNERLRGAIDQVEALLRRASLPSGEEPPEED
jgi:HTH-type transcriptional repressor of NAD biosynthesis genes